MPTRLDFFLNSTRKLIVLIGAGFIGSALATYLSSHNYKVLILKRDIRNTDPLHPNITYVYGDYSNHEILSATIQPDSEVIFLAPLSPGRVSDLTTPVNINLSSFISLLKFVSGRNSRLIFLSSGGTIYGNVKSFPISESCKKNPISLYGMIKLKAEELIYDYADNENLKYICLRPSNVYGPGQLPHTGQGFIPTAIKDVIDGKEVNIFGSGSAVRDYIYIDDFIHAIFLLIQNSDSSGTYNIGTGVGISILDIIEHLNKIAKKKNLKIAFKLHPSRPVDVKKNILDISKIISRTKWQPQTNFADGLEMTFRWVEEGVANETI